MAGTAQDGGGVSEALLVFLSFFSMETLRPALVDEDCSAGSVKVKSGRAFGLHPPFYGREIQS